MYSISNSYVLRQFDNLIFKQRSSKFIVVSNVVVLQTHA